MASGYSSLDAAVNTQIFRKDHPMILACNRHHATILPVRLVYQANGYPAGTVLGRVTATGFYAAYNDALSTGVEVAAGVLFDDCTPASGDTEVARCIFKGEVFQAKLTGLDAAAIVDLKARSITDATATQILMF